MNISQEMKDKIKNEGYELTEEKKSLNNAEIGDILLDTGEPPVAYQVVDKKQVGEENVLTLKVVVGDPESGLSKGYTDSIGYGKNDQYIDMFVLKPIKTAATKRLKMASGVTYIATAPVTFTARAQYGDGYADDTLGIEFFSDLKDAVKNEMSEMGADGLAEYLDLRSGLYDIVESIIVGVEKQGNNVISKTIIKAKEELLAEDIEELKEYIIGQFSDGWGEGFEQRPIGDWDEEEETEEWDEEAQENYKDSYTETYEVLAHFWNAKNFNLSIQKV